MERRDIHDYLGREERAMRSVQSSSMSERNKEIISKFRNFCFAQGLTRGRIAKHLWGMLVMGRILKKDFDKVVREDIENLIAELRSHDYASSTLTDFNITIKKFYNWLRQYPPKQYPPEVRWLSTAKKDEQLRDPSEDLTIEEIKRLAGVAQHPRDKALVWVLYESAARVGELLQVRIKDVTFNHVTTVKIWGEKVRKWREVPMIQSRADLAMWIDTHPFRDSPDSPLWITWGIMNHNKPLSYNGVKEMIRNLAKRAGITKPVNPHSFRHSRLSFLGDYLTDAQLGDFAGWKPGSKMSRVYVRPKMTNNAIMSIYGEKFEEEKKIVDQRICNICKNVNSPESKICRNCGTVIDVETVLSIAVSKTNALNESKNKYE